MLPAKISWSLLSKRSPKLRSWHNNPVLLFMENSKPEHLIEMELYEDQLEFQKG